MKRIIILAITFLIASPSIFGQKAGKNDTIQHIVYKYTCPMHPEVGSNTPGKCTKCGMNLVLSKKEEAKLYTCPMHVDVLSDKPGKCPRCGMDLILSKKEQFKKEVTKTYYCPMHPDVISDSTGRCPTCGMELQEKKQ